jgi:regulator of protease activity HflC (stomatin/prohibitin superfamily)
MERSIQKIGLINLLALLGIGVAAFAVARYANSLAGQVSILFLLLGFLVAAVSWFQMRLEDNERVERFEFDELTKSRSSSALFESKDAELFAARRSREQFERFFVPIFTVILCLLQAGGAWWLWRWVSKNSALPVVKQPSTALALFALFAIILFIIGKFSSSFARLEHHRLLRPVSSYVLLDAYICFVVALGIAAIIGGYLKADLYAAYGLCLLLAVIALETLINLVLEIYRPRVKGKVARPLYDGRLVGLLAQPEGLFTTAAQAIDYQFGFKVSETWFYRLFFERALKWLILAQIAVLVLSTCFVFIDAGEQGLLEHFGKPVARSPLGPGAWLKWPWPIDHVYRFRTEQIQSFEIGVPSETEQEQEAFILWTLAHTKVDNKPAEEDNFLVANRVPTSANEQSSLEDANQPGTKRTPPVSLITGSIPIQFQITNLLSWAYTNEDAPSLLQDLARREIVRFFVSADMGEILAQGRLEASRQMQQRIQGAADQHQLGAKIVSVGLQDMHPPVKVAPDYEKVVAGIHTKQAKILAARADEIRTNALAGAQAVTIVNRATADAKAREIGAFAQAGLFTNQLPAYAAAPSVYVERAYLQAFTRATANARKYVLLTTNTHDVLQFDLQESIARDILRDVSVPPPKK